MAAEKLKLAVIVGSIREGRYCPTVGSWIAAQAESHPEFDVDVIDLADTPLPAEGQAKPVTNGEYDSPDTQAFAKRIGAADGFVIITPEYNHGYPGPLKIAIDAVYPEWIAKPVGFISYGGIAGGLRSVEQLRQVFGELHAVTIRETVSFHMVWGQFGPDGQPTDPIVVNGAAKRLLDQLAWWAQSLREAREARPYPA
jgi:NAD(P)H-dependent FMN reductase